MNFTDAIKKSFLENLESAGLSTTEIIITLGVTFAISVYIYLIYRLVIKSTFYNKSFHVSMAAISLITAGIIVAMQSSIVISLGMVGALSIVRFRTAIKDPMDLLFLFWSIGTGIICGAGLYELAVIVALSATVCIFTLTYLPDRKKPYLLIINCDTLDVEDQIIAVLKEMSKYYKIKSRNIKKSGMDFIIELHTGKEKEVVRKIAELDQIRQVSLLSHDGEVRI